MKTLWYKEMFGQNKNNSDIDKDTFKKSDNNNPFTRECRDCVADIWSIIKRETNNLNDKCYPNTYVWIEKFKDDNY